jgi:hypothetical protein
VDKTYSFQGLTLRKLRLLVEMILLGMTMMKRRVRMLVILKRRVRYVSLIHLTECCG